MCRVPGTRWTEPQRVRVTGGELAGRRLQAPRGASVRPTADRVRESVFGRLGPLHGRSVLDLYAGSGALGIEALSRGAARAVFVDRAGACVAQIRRNLEALGVAEGAEVRRGDAVRAVARLAAGGARFDLVLADPPYASREAVRLLDAVAAAGLLASGGMLVLETSRHDAPGRRPGLRIDDVRRYGDTLVVRYVVDPAGAAGAAGGEGDGPPDRGRPGAEGPGPAGAAGRSEGSAGPEAAQDPEGKGEA